MIKGDQACRGDADGADGHRGGRFCGSRSNPAVMRRPKVTKRLQCRENLRTFNDMMNTQAALGFRHLRRFWIGHPGWVAV